MLEQYIPIMMHLLVAVGFAATTLLMSVWLGRKAKTKTEIKDSPYECGMLPIGESQPRFSVKFYVVAMLWTLYTDCPLRSIPLTYFFQYQIVCFVPLRDDKVIEISLQRFCCIRGTPGSVFGGCDCQGQGLGGDPFQG